MQLLAKVPSASILYDPGYDHYLCCQPGTVYLVWQEVTEKKAHGVTGGENHG